MKRVFYVEVSRMENKVFELLDIKFSYNGELGRLQQKTIDNRNTCNSLLQWNVITHEEYKEAMQAINDYFVEQIKRVLDNPQHYINW